MSNFIPKADLQTSSPRPQKKKKKKRKILQEEYISAVTSCRDSVGKVKAHLELNLSRDMKGNKIFHEYLISKIKTRESMSPLLNEAGSLVTNDMEKDGVLNAFFTSVFAIKINIQESQALRSVRRSAARRAYRQWRRTWLGST